MLPKTMISRYLLVTDTVIVRCSIHRTSTWESSLPNRCLAILIERTNGFSYATGARRLNGGAVGRLLLLSFSMHSTCGVLCTGLATEGFWVRIRLVALRFGTWPILFTPLCQCFSEETLKSVGPFCLVSMPGEVKYPTHGVNVYSWVPNKRPGTRI